MSADLEPFIAAAAGRPFMALWGKAQPEGPTPAHPLLHHMLDVAVVAERLLSVVLPEGLSSRLASAFGLPPGTEQGWLTFFVALHDLGKATPAFQAKVAAAVPHLRGLGFDVAPPLDARDHGTIGVRLARAALVDLGFDEDLAHPIARSVAAHHGSFPTDHEADGPAQASELGNAAWAAARRDLAGELARCLGARGLPVPTARRTSDWGALSILAGLTSVADWLGSMAEHFTYTPPMADPRDYVTLARDRALVAMERAGFRARAQPEERSFFALFGFEPRPLQSAVEEALDRVAGPFCAIVEAPMGEGKTEAALCIAHRMRARGQHGGVYIGLPTQATANQMFNRLTEFLAATRSEDERITLSLLHGEAVFDSRVRRLLAAVYGKPDEALVCEHWFLSKKRALLAPFGAGTIDQALLAVLRTRHAFVRQLGLAGKTVVLDEVHAYDTYTSTLLDRLVGWLGALGASVVILSATLPASRREALLRAYSGDAGKALAAGRYPRIAVTTRDGEPPFEVAIGGSRPSTGVSIDWLADEDCVLDGLIRDLVMDGGCVGVLHNTVRRAQRTYRALREAREVGAIPPDTEALLLHARFPAADRQALEARLIAALGKKGARPHRLVVVGTQVLEQSLDIDFDRMITDLAPIDLLLQRAGRLHRHDRPTRPPRHVEPTLTVVAPEGDPLGANLDEVGRVYEPYVLRRSLMLLRERGAIRLPEDIDELVQAVYTLEEPEHAREALARERAAMVAERGEDEQLARERAWPAPTRRSDPFAALLMPYEEDDARVARMLRAETRLGDESAELVCLFGDASNAFLDAAREQPLDLAAPLEARTVQALAQRTVRVSTRGLVRALTHEPIPPSFGEVAPLRRRHPVFFGAGPVRIGDFDLDLDVELGLLVERAPKEG